MRVRDSLPLRYSYFPGAHHSILVTLRAKIKPSKYGYQISGSSTLEVVLCPGAHQHTFVALGPKVKPVNEGHHSLRFSALRIFLLLGCPSVHDGNLGTEKLSQVTMVMEVCDSLTLTYSSFPDAHPSSSDTLRAKITPSY